MSAQIPTEFKSRLIQTCHDYCADKGYSTMVGVVDGGVSCYPEGFAKNGVVTFDLSGAAVRSLEFSDEWLSFVARFNGVASEVSLHVDEIAWVGSPDSDCMLGFAAKVLEANAEDEDKENEIVSHEDVTERAARNNLKLI